MVIIYEASMQTHAQMKAYMLCVLVGLREQHKIIQILFEQETT